MIQSLNGKWNLYLGNHTKPIDAVVPGSLYSALMANGIMSDPYYRLNQYSAEKYSEDDCTYEHVFIPDEELLTAPKKILRFKGIDTISDVYFNNIRVGGTDNMHRAYEFDVTDLIHEGSNNVKVYIQSPVKYINKKNAERSLWGVSSTMAGYPHIRKAHYMFGWDWGPQLPDMGIWRSVEVIGVFGGRIESVYVRQNHKPNSVRLTLEAAVTDVSSDLLRAEVIIVSPDGTRSTMSTMITTRIFALDCLIANPYLWNVRGYGKPNLYMVTLVLFDGDEPVDRHEFNIGLRTVEVCREPDAEGEEFCFKVNGIKIFAMGANYIPEDQILDRTSAERTKELLKSCAAANYNMIRVWGGGIYPDDYFYDLCDKLGLLVWQDMMFACSVYNASDMAFCSTVRYELIDNIRRIRNHACLGMWCGNNEIESAWQYWGLPDDEELKAGYLRMFEVLAPKVVEQYDPNTFYWPSSPSSGGGFKDSGARNKGDIHYWDVWHNFKPFTEYKKYIFRFCSEYGFESIPCMKTVRSFAEPQDLNLMAPVMEAHQKCEAGNEKLMYYIAQMTHYPYSFENLVYASQIVQADAIRLNVEQMRRHRGLCMGSLYWQVNDSNPVISWSSIDYFGRWKALHYYAKKFYAPVLCSIDDSNKNNLVINISNEKLTAFEGTLKWRVRKNTAEIIADGEQAVSVPPLSAKDCLTLTKEMTGVNEDMYSECYIEYLLLQDNAVVSDSTFMYCLPKQFEFLDPEIEFTVNQIGDMYRFKISSKKFAKGVYLDFDDMDCVFSDNWFDLHGQDTYVIVNRMSLPLNVTLSDIEEKLKIKSYFDLSSPENYR